MASPRILNQKKKYREWEIEPITSLAPGRIPSRRVVAGKEIKPQYKSKPNTELNKPNTEHRGVYQKKKKKIPNTQTKTKPSNPQTVTSPSSSPQHRRRRSPGRPSSQIEERRSLCLCSSARCSPLNATSGLPWRYFALFLSNSLSVSRSLSHWN